jgi:hypothetical protein
LIRLAARWEQQAIARTIVYAHQLAIWREDQECELVPIEYRSGSPENLHLACPSSLENNFYNQFNTLQELGNYGEVADGELAVALDEC